MKALFRNEHLWFTLAFVSIGLMIGVEWPVLLVCAGFWLGREMAQAEYRYIEKYRLKDRSTMTWKTAFKPELWNQKSLIDDMVFPVFVGVVMIVAWRFIWPL